jgi:hypothetical protein
MFSKPIKDNVLYKNSKVVESQKFTLSFEDYFSKQIVLKKYKLPELKSIIKEYNLKRTGNKDVLINRIETYFSQIKCAKNIQRVFRGWLTRYSFKIRGEAFLDKQLCTNDTDFATLEPLSEIPFELFFSYKDEKNYIYGFNICSLIQVLKTKGKISNPYNREIVGRDVLKKIVTLNNLIKIVFPGSLDDDSAILKIIMERQTTSNNLIGNQRSIDILSSHYYSPQINVNEASMTPEMMNSLRKILVNRRKDVSERIRILFGEIDQLGNYTHHNWFSVLNREYLIRMYRYLDDIWRHRANLSQTVKSAICPFFNPFTNVFVEPIHHSNISEDQIRFLCLTVMENIVYSGIDEDHRKLGAMHVLSALTLVSHPARRAIPWLYESIAY